MYKMFNSSAVQKQFKLVSSHLELSPFMHVYLLLLLASPPSCPLVALVSLLAEWGGFGRVGGRLQGEHTLSNPSLRARSDGPGGLVGAHDFQINGGRSSAGSFPTCKVMFHVPGVGSRSRDQREGIRVKEGKGNYEVMKHLGGRQAAVPPPLLD